MNVGFLADKIPYATRRGWGVYASELLRTLLQTDHDNNYHCFYNLFRKGDRDCIVAADNPRVRNHVWPLPGRFMDLVWDRWPLLPVELFVGKVDVVHVPYELLPPVRSAKTVVSVHDVTYMRHPELLDDDFVAMSKRRIRRVAERADQIVASSQNTMNELLEFTGASPERVVVVPLAVARRFAPVENQALVDEVLARFGIARPYVLFVGAADADKNLRRLAAACARVRAAVPHLSLVLAGRDDWGFARLMDDLRKAGHDERIVRTGFVSDADLRYLYAGAEVLALPSIHEGFGLPVVEAMACGTAVLTSNAASLPEVVGDAGVMVDPHDVEAIADGLRRLLSDDALRAGFVAKGLERAATFSWEATARRTIEIYQRVL